MCEVSVRKFEVVDGMKFLVERFGIPGCAVYPTSPDKGVDLIVDLADGSFVVGEETIDTVRKSSPIVNARLSHKSKALPEALAAIEEADLIILGPGSLYGSVITHLLVDGVVDSIKRSKAMKLYMCNFANDATESPGFSAEMYAEVLTRFLGREEDGFRLDAMLINNGFFVENPDSKFGYRVIEEKDLAEDLKNAYLKEEKGFVRVADMDALEKYVKFVYRRPLVTAVQSGSKTVLRHDPGITAGEIMSIYKNYLNFNLEPSKKTVTV